MWVLQSYEGSPETLHYLPCGLPLVVSRKEGHILLADDDSISRQHAQITVTHSIDNLKNPSILPTVVLKNLKSKYGSFVNEGIESLQETQGERTLENNDTIRFGRRMSIWRLKYRDLIVTTSALQPASKGELQQSLVTLGGHLVGDWTASCSYLVMNNITLTVKVVCALAAVRHIVTPDFFKKWVEAVLSKTDLPIPSTFQPPLQEISINKGTADFSPIEERKSVLAGKTFLFTSTKQMKRMNLAVNLAGGKTCLLSEDNYQLVQSPDYLLVQLTEKNQDPNRLQLYASAKDILKSNKLRIIPESDIGLAILYVSTEAHCNPSFVVSDILKRNTSSMTQSEVVQGLHIYASETQDTESNSVSLTGITGTRIVPESGVTSTRRTTATLQSTTIPPSGVNVADTATGSTCASTNASFLSLSKRYGPLKNTSENNSNVATHESQNTKWKVPCKEPNIRRSSKPQDLESHHYVPEPTQPLDSQENHDEKENSPELGVSKFIPHHSSTQKPYINVNSNKANGRISPSENEPVANDKCDTSKGAPVPSLEPTLGRSIPFEPYTLPSLNAEPYIDDSVASETSQLDISTQPYQRIKPEPSSLPIEEPDCQARKRRRDEEIDMPNEDAPMWLEAKKKKDDLGNKSTKKERQSFDDDMVHETIPRIKQERQSLDDLFALPMSERRKNRSNGKRKLPEESTSNKEGGDLFDLPCTSRAERRRKAPKTEELIKSETNATQQNQSKLSNGNSSGREKDSSDTSAPWISRKTQAAPTSDSSANLEGSSRESALKNESRSGDVDEITRDFQDLVQLMPLVKQRLPAPSSSASTQEMLSKGSFKNFKQFKKATRGDTALPKIIGGRDLVPDHVLEVRSKRNDWFSQNPDVTRELERRDAHQNMENDPDEFFDLPQRQPRYRGRRAI